MVWFPFIHNMEYFPPFPTTLAPLLFPGAAPPPCSLWAGLLPQLSPRARWGDTEPAPCRVAMLRQVQRGHLQMAFLPPLPPPPAASEISYTWAQRLKRCGHLVKSKWPMWLWHMTYSVYSGLKNISRMSLKCGDGWENSQFLGIVVICRKFWIKAKFRF